MIIIIIIESSTGAHLPDRCVASSARHGFSFQWPGTCAWNVSYAVKGQHFFHGPQSDTSCLFLTGFIALPRFPHFPVLSDPIEGIFQQVHGESSPRQSACWRSPQFHGYTALFLYSGGISLNSAIFFLYCRANYIPLFQRHLSRVALGSFATFN